MTVEDARGVLDRTADRADARVDALLDQAVSAHELLRRRDADAVVRVGRAPDRRACFLGNGTGHEVCAHGRARSRARAAGTALRIVGIAEGAAESAARNGRGELAEIRLGDNDRAGLTKPAHERRIVGRPIVGVEGVGARRRAHVERVVLVLDRRDDAVQRTYELARRLEVRVERACRFERVRHGRIVVVVVRHAPGLAGVESPAHARRGPEVQRRERIDLSGVRYRCNRSENAFGLVDAGAVIGLDACEIELDELLGRQMTGADRALNVRDRRFLEVELFLCDRGRCDDLAARLVGAGQREEKERRNQCRGLQWKSRHRSDLVQSRSVGSSAA